MSKRGVGWGRGEGSREGGKQEGDGGARGGRKEGDTAVFWIDGGPHTHTHTHTQMREMQVDGRRS